MELKTLNIKPLCSLFLVYFQFQWLFGFLYAMSGVNVSVRIQCEWAWYWLSGRMYTIYYIYSDTHTSTREAIKINHLTYPREAGFARQLHTTLAES